MLDHVSISHQSGLVLWSRSFTPAFAAIASSPASPISALIRESFIENKAQDAFEKDGYSVRWTVDNGLELVFVVVFPALLPLTYIPALLDRTRQLFVSLFQPLLQSLITDLAGGMSSSLPTLQQRIIDERWDLIFDRCLRNCESTKREPTAITAPSTPTPSGETLTAEEIAKNVESLKSRLRRKKGSTPTPPASSPRKGAAAAKLMRKWNDSPVSASDMAALDYSAPTTGEEPVNTDGLVSHDAMGKRTEVGYEVAEWDFRSAQIQALPTEEEILARQTSKISLEPKQSSWSNVFSRLTGATMLTKENLDPVLADMERNLMDKNVAKDIAEKMCEGVSAALVGQKLGGLTSVRSKVQDALSSSLTRVLTPKTSTDILLDIKRKRASLDTFHPYAMTFVGVNGVGKSTNLSKVCFWLLQNGLRVLIAACDTFRSGAVEQLRVHVRNLGALHTGVELYERGYGKDAAGIAKDAIAYAKENAFDVVLIDTAGRMQDNEPLMRALAKLVTVNNPDKIIFVGEALVGNEAVDQLTKFDRSLKDFSAVGGSRRRGIDGIILTKFDTIDDKVGAALSMTFVTGQPILFVGCGQTYTDLRHLRVGHIVQALLA